MGAFPTVWMLFCFFGADLCNVILICLTRKNNGIIITKKYIQQLKDYKIKEFFILKAAAITMLSIFTLATWSLYMQQHTWKKKKKKSIYYPGKRNSYNPQFSKIIIKSTCSNKSFLLLLFFHLFLYHYHRLMLRHRWQFLVL